MDNSSNPTWKADLLRADTEFKVALSLYFVLLAVSTLLLQFLAKISFLSRDYISGFLPFAFLLLPYILFSSRFFTDLYRTKLGPSVALKLIFPAYLTAVYSVFTAMSSSFNFELFIKLLVWFAVPCLIYALSVSRSDEISFKDILVAFILWLPIEFGKLAGFDIVFNKDIVIPALPFAAPAIGLYLFVILRNLPDVGFSFKLKASDFRMAGLGLLMLAPLLIPLGTLLGFIRFSTLDLNVWKTLELLLGIYFMVAIPEELLFRGIIQNLLMKSFLGKFGKLLPLSIAAVIFGLSHWNNFNPPDWRYVVLASIAGMVYGFVYIRTGKTTASALVHCGVNFLWAVLFKDTSG